MYLGAGNRTYYGRGGEQRCTRAPFLILMLPERDWKEPRPPLRALVRSVALHQCGHYMMGRTRIGQHTIPLSGSYGNDGLPREVPKDAYERGVELPAELEALYWKGDGWNSAGSEAMDMAKWAWITFNLKGVPPWERQSSRSSR